MSQLASPRPPMAQDGDAPAPPPTTFLFGGSRPWSSHDWASSDDRVRGGRSRSYLTPASSRRADHCARDRYSAAFHGHLDISALGGAGFASQRTVATAPRDLSAYAGLRLDVDASDGKKYTLTLKDALLPRRDDGREQSSVTWEVDFRPAPHGGSVWLPWEAFRPTYRGREVRDAEPLRVEHVQRISLMMRSFFGDQEGDFELRIQSIAAAMKEESAYRDDPHMRRSMDVVDEKRHSPIPARQGWLGWLIGYCLKL